MSNTIWISAAEPSGDMHGALLLKELQLQSPALQFEGMGGQQLRNAGLTAHVKSEDLSVMGITEVLGHLPRIYGMLKKIKKQMALSKPLAVIVIDAPDFHFKVIEAAVSLGIPVYYYISPKIWAWRQGRANFIKKNVRKVISILPFEVDFYKKFGMNIDYVGNPLVDIVDYPSLEHIAFEKNVIGFLPGSRKSEVSSLLPEFSKAASILHKRLPQLEFSVVQAPNLSAEYVKSFWQADVPVSFVSPDNRWQFMRKCEMLIAASGTVTLESAIVGTPTIATYKVSAVSYAVGKALIKVPFMSLANLILQREVFPELLQNNCDAEPLAQKALEWLLPQATSSEGAPLDAVRRELEEVRSLLGKKGAPARAAQVVLSDLFS